MDDVVGVLWGAVIALVASVLGGLLTAVVGPWLGRRADAKAREKQAVAEAEAERQRVLRDAIQRVSESMRLWLEAWGQGRDDDKARHRGEVREANIVLRLWTSNEERQIGSTVVEVLSATHPYDAAYKYSAWDDAAVRWFRGVLPAAEFGADYEASVEENAGLADRMQAEAQEKRRAAQGGTSFTEPPRAP